MKNQESLYSTYYFAKLSVHRCQRTVTKKPESTENNRYNFEIICPIRILKIQALDNLRELGEPKHKYSLSNAPTRWKSRSSETD